MMIMMNRAQKNKLMKDVAARADQAFVANGEITSHPNDPVEMRRLLQFQTPGNFIQQPEQPFLFSSRF